MKANGTQAIRNIVVVGGGSAGWITAGLLAATYPESSGSGIRVTLVESPDVKIIGVGEGTWPTMRTTLSRIGISETDFIRGCAASFKQGTRFIGWVNGAEDDIYYHPFTAPAGYTRIDLASHWQAHRDRVSFANAVTAQGQLCDRDLAPKQESTPEFAAVANYAYHLDAGEFARMLQQHCTQQLGVRHVQDHVSAVNRARDGDIESLRTSAHGDIEGDLFVDCTGFASLLLGQHYGVPFNACNDVLINDTALAAQVPYADESAPIASQTIAAAQDAGWIWDIGLTTRRGIGYVHSSAHADQETAEVTIRDYIQRTSGMDADAIPLRRIEFKSGHREHFWHRNCVAVGMSAGFIEPLEASALVMVELSAAMITDELPGDRSTMDIVAKRFNETFRYRWQRIIDFLKLHYVLSRRDTPYWHAQRASESVPASLADFLRLWRERPPSTRDFPRVDEVFSAASHQYVLYGMGFQTAARPSASMAREADRARELFIRTNEQAKQWVRNLPDHRALLTRIARQGLPAE